jgi:hypothetical protein
MLRIRNPIKASFFSLKLEVLHSYEMSFRPTLWRTQIIREMENFIGHAIHTTTTSILHIERFRLFSNLKGQNNRQKNHSN